MVFVDSKYPSFLCRSFTVVLCLLPIILAILVFPTRGRLDNLLSIIANPAIRKPSSAIYEILELATSQLCAFDAEDERDGVHEV
jgi:hypothetical protein